MRFDAILREQRSGHFPGRVSTVLLIRGAAVSVSFPAPSTASQRRDSLVTAARCAGATSALRVPAITTRID